MTTLCTRIFWRSSLLTAALVGCVAQSNSPVRQNVAETEIQKTVTSPLHLTILATTDLHANLRAYDYYKDAPVDHYGLSKVATLIKEERKKDPDALLVDAGDLLQGSPLGDVLARVEPLKNGQVHAAFKAMNMLGYNVATVGNHEFNYGLPFLKNALSGAKFPYVTTSVYLKNSAGTSMPNANAETPLANPTQIVVANVGGKKVRVGFLGFAPPQIMDWDKDKLAGKLNARDILDSAREGVALLRKQGVDVIVAVAHTGINPLPYDHNMENAAYHLAKLDGIDAVVTGHSHLEFPGKKFEGQEKLGIDANAGTVHGKPVVMAGFWGSHLGILTLNLENNGDAWKAIGGHSALRSVKGVAEDSEVVAAVEREHAATLKYVRSPVGAFSKPVQTYFSRVADTAAVQLVNQAQTWFARKELKGSGYEAYPLLSASAPFKAGFGGEYTQIDAGKVAIKNVADLYMYPNTIKAVLLNGAQVKDWLEKSAQNFSQVDVSRDGEISLVNDKFPSYNFDVFSGVAYEIDVSKPVGSRILNLRYWENGNGKTASQGKPGKPLANTDRVVVVTNNYRASGGGGFPHLDGKNIVLDSATENRQVLLDYIQSQKLLGAEATLNWKIAPLPKSKAKVVFETSILAKSFLPSGFKLISENRQNQTAKFEMLP